MKAIIIITLLVLVKFKLEYGGNGPDTRTTADRIHSFGYSSETHNVLTEDGYNLTIFRLNNSLKVGHEVDGNSSKPVVLMMHGLISSSDCWVLNGPNDALAFNLVDSGYDVWLGNARGTPYSKRHLSMSPEDRAFWRFSWHEIGVFDLPATINYILNTTGQTSLHYVGHSQGTAIMFVLLSTEPKYNKVLKTSHMLAPIAYMKYARSPLIYYLSPILGSYTPLNSLLGDMPFLQQKFVRVALGYEKCRNPAASPEVCAAILFAMAGGVSRYMNSSLFPEIFNSHPASCSTHQAIHLIQLHVSGRFRPYDYGFKRNMQRYKRPTPPDYQVANIKPKFPLHFYYSDFDELSSKTDVENFSRILGANSVNHFIDLNQFAHIDFLWANNVKEVINKGILERMNEMELGLDPPSPPYE